MQHFTGRTAVITGAASGIGRAMAERFAREGMKLVLADIEAAALEAVVDALCAGGPEAIGVRTDVGEFEQIEELARRSFETFGAV